MPIMRPFLPFSAAIGFSSIESQPLLPISSGGNQFRLREHGARLVGHSGDRGPTASLWGAGPVGFVIGTVNSCDRRLSRSSSAASRGSPALVIARTCFNSSFRASVSGTRARATSIARSGSSWSTKN